MVNVNVVSPVRVETVLIEPYGVGTAQLKWILDEVEQLSKAAISCTTVSIDRVLILIDTMPQYDGSEVKDASEKAPV